jgi:hypothetical protein
MRKRLWAFGVALAGMAFVAVVAGACNGDETPTATDTSPTADAGSPTPGTSPTSPATGNLFPNGDFESGRDPWYSLKPPDFILTRDIAHSGETSALLRMREGTETEGAKVFYLVQEITPEEFPEVISGYYRIENWRKGTPKQYAQFVVIVFAAENTPDGFPNHQIRYLLAGIDTEPFAISNAKFVFLSREEPVEGEWVYFERNVREDFLTLWGSVPIGYEKIRVLFEVRYDDKLLGEGPVEADAYYDDLYIGPPQ